jgi:endonuclease/exonuclease/phosphatase family metal-dependent hydrolase
MPNNSSNLSCVSWNVHRGRGADGIIDPTRTAAVLCEEVCNPETEVLVLQEADEEQSPHRGFLDIGGIEDRTGLRYIHTNIQHRWGQQSHGFLGVVCFIHPSIRVEAVQVLDMPGHCHRGAVILELRKGSQPIRLIGTHLSLFQAFRIAQMRTLGQHLFRHSAKPTVLCGDLNEWRPWGGFALSKWVLGAEFSGPARPTFPVQRPFLPLDRFLSADGAKVERTVVLNGSGIRAASDHRALSARINLYSDP